MDNGNNHEEDQKKNKRIALSLLGIFYGGALLTLLLVWSRLAIANIMFVIYIALVPISFILALSFRKEMVRKGDKKLAKMMLIAIVLPAGILMTIPLLIFGTCVITMAR